MRFFYEGVQELGPFLEAVRRQQGRSPSGADGGQDFHQLQKPHRTAPVLRLSSLGEWKGRKVSYVLVYGITENSMMLVTNKAKNPFPCGAGNPPLYGVGCTSNVHCFDTTVPSGRVTVSRTVCLPGARTASGRKTTCPFCSAAVTA